MTKIWAARLITFVLCLLLSACGVDALLLSPDDLAVIPGLPVPPNWSMSTEQLPCGPQPRCPDEATVTNYTAPGFPSDLGERGPYLVRVTAETYSSQSLASRGYRAVVKDLCKHTSSVRPERWLGASEWADAINSCENLENHGMAFIQWRYRNLVVTAQYYTSAHDGVSSAMVAAVFRGIDAHLQHVVLGKRMATVPSENDKVQESNADRDIWEKEVDIDTSSPEGVVLASYQALAAEDVELMGQLWAIDEATRLNVEQAFGEMLASGVRYDITNLELTALSDDGVLAVVRASYDEIIRYGSETVGPGTTEDIITLAKKGDSWYIISTDPEGPPATPQRESPSPAGETSSARWTRL